MKAYFSDLPQPLQEELAKFTKTGDYGSSKFYLTEGTGGKLFGVIFGALVLGGMAVLAVLNSQEWDLPGALGAGGIASLFVMMILFNLVRLRRYKRSRSRPGIVANPLLLGMLGLEQDVVWMFYHMEIVDHQVTHHLRNGAYQYTAFNFKYKSGSLSFTLNSKVSADQLMEYLRGCGAIVQAWVQSGIADEQIKAYDWIATGAEAAAKADAPHPRRGLMNSGWAKFGISVAAGMAFAFILFGINQTLVEMRRWEYATRDDSSEAYQMYLEWAPFKWHKKEAEIRMDDRAYTRAVLDKKAGSLRAYLKRFPSGRHVAEARQELVALYTQAEQAYLARASKAVPQAAAGIRALLAHLREKPTPAAHIKFVAGPPLDDKAIDASAFKSTGSKKVRSMGPSFSPERNHERESRILAVMKASFRTVFSDDLFDLVGLPPGADDARFLVAYTVAPSGMIYTWNREKDLPIEEREVFVGMQIRFSFTLQVPGSEHPVHEDPEKGYAFAMTVKPAPNFDVVGEGATQVYDRMAATSFEKFEIDLANAYGLERTMPENWGQLGGSTRPRIDPPKFKLPDLKLKKSLETIITETLVLVPAGGKEPEVAAIEAQVKARASIWQTPLPDDETLRAKIRAGIAAWKAKNAPPKEDEEK
jgi:hypothetical protein